MSNIMLNICKCFEDNKKVQILELLRNHDQFNVISLLLVLNVIRAMVTGLIGLKEI